MSTPPLSLSPSPSPRRKPPSPSPSTSKRPQNNILNKSSSSFTLNSPSSSTTSTSRPKSRSKHASSSDSLAYSPSSNPSPSPSTLSPSPYSPASSTFSNSISISNSTRSKSQRSPGGFKDKDRISSMSRKMSNTSLSQAKRKEHIVNDNNNDDDDDESSNKLDSIMSFLSSAETSLNSNPNSTSASHEILYRNNTQTTDHQQPQQQSVSSSISVGRKWLWDELPSPAPSSSSSSYYSQSTSFPPETPSNPPPPSPNTVDRFASLRLKITSLQDSLTSKRNESLLLKTKLARIHTSHTSTTKRINDSWTQRSLKRTNEHNDALQRQDLFISDLTKSNKVYEVRKNDLTEVLKLRVDHLPVAIDLAKREVKSEVKLKREEWVNAEKVQLSLLAESKGKELKREAVKALEPEISRLISGNKIDFKEKEKVFEGMFQKFMEGVKRDGEDRLNDVSKEYDEKGKIEAEVLKLKQAQSLELIANEQENDLKLERQKFRENLDAEGAVYEKLRKDRVMEFEIERGRVKDEEEMKFKRVEADNEKDLKVIKSERDDKVGFRRDEIDIEMGEWKEIKLVELRREQAKREEAEYNILKEQSSADLTMVTSKLSNIQTGDFQKLKDDFQRQLESLRGNLKAAEGKAHEEEQVVMGRYAIEFERFNVLNSEIQVQESKIVNIERKVAAAESNLKAEKGKSENIMKEFDFKMESLKVGAARASDDVRKEVKGLEDKGEEMVIGISEMHVRHGKEVERLEARNEAQLAQVTERIASLLERKEGKLVEGEEELKRLKEEGAKVMEEVGELRRWSVGEREG